MTALTSRNGRHRLKGQPASRRFQVWTDQHGRQWGSEIEIKTGDPTGVIMPIDWQAPDPRLLPEQKYLMPLVDGAGRAVAGRLEVNYTQWMAEYQVLADDYKKQLAFFAAAMYGEKAGQALESPTPELLLMLGTKPPFIEPIYAASQGDIWALGIKVRKPIGNGRFKTVDAPRPEWADKYLPALPANSRGQRVTLDPDFVKLFDATKSQKDDETDAEREARARTAAAAAGS